MIKSSSHAFKYPGIRAAVDGNTAVVMCERESTDAAGAYPITPSTQMGEYWAEAAAQGHLNISGRPLIFIEPEGEHAAAAVTAGLSMTGLRAANFSSGQGIAYMHESLYAAVGKRLTYVLNIGARAMTKSTLNVHAGHDDYHCIDDTGFFQMFAQDAQAAADLNILAHRIAELSLNPGVVAQDGFLTTHLIESIRLPERELIAEFLGRPDDLIDTPTAAQRIIYGAKRRRIPELWNVDNSMLAGAVQNQDAYMQSVAAQRPFFFDHIREFADQSFADFYALTGRHYDRVMEYQTDDAEYLLIGQGSMIATAQAVADYLRETRGLRVGVVNLLMWRPFPADRISQILKGKRGATVFERLDQPLAVELPMMREIRACISQCFENGRDQEGMPFPSIEIYRNLDDAPDLYSASFGMGSRDLQPEAVIGAVENMLPDGAQKKFYYLSIDFLHDHPQTPKQELRQEAIQDAYPHVRQLAVHGSENPNLMPKNCITVRLHSVGGWGAITTGKNLAMTLFDLLGYHIKANPKYGSEKKGQPTTYYLSAAPEPIRVNCEYIFVDVVLSPDPNVFQHTNAIAGLKQGGCFIIQSDLKSPAEVWASIPDAYRKIIVAKEINLFYLDAFEIARQEASDSDLRLRMQGIAFQGAFFKVSPVAAMANLSESQLLSAITDQLQHKFGDKGARVVHENVAVVKRGYDEVKPVPYGSITLETVQTPQAKTEPPMPVMLRRQPQGHEAISDIHRFWEQTGSFYARGMGSDNLADPFIGLGTMPAATAVFRDMTSIRFQYPKWIAENCTACGNCYTACPDTAIPGLVSEISGIFETIVKRLKDQGKSVNRIRPLLTDLEVRFRRLLNQSNVTDNTASLLHQAIEDVISAASGSDEASLELTAQFSDFSKCLGSFPFALSTPYFTNRESKTPGDGGLLSITVNPQTCKGCMQCVAVCNDDALRPQNQSPTDVKELKANWDFWLDLPNTPSRYIRIDNIDDAVGALHTLLLDKRNYQGMTGGDGACLGCGEKTIVHLFIATVEALMRPRVEKHIAELTELIANFERHIQSKLIHEIDLSATGFLQAANSDDQQGDLTLADLASQVERTNGAEPIDRQWLKNVSQTLSKLKALHWKYTEGSTGKGRARMGILNSTGCSSVWGSTYPYNPYPFPWANHLFQDSPSLAMGVFEGHMAKMAEGFKAIRMARHELTGKGSFESEMTRLEQFNWNDFSDQEWDLCPPVVAVGGDGAMYDIGFQNLSRCLMSGKPIKVLVLDTQVYSNTGGQACTAGFMSQISDMAPFGKAKSGKEEIRKEIGLIGMAHRTAYVMQSTIAHSNHMIEGFIQGLKSRRPALFNIFASCQPEHGIGDDKSTDQAKLAVESRAYPLFRYDPDRGPKPSHAFDLDGNPAIDDLWPSYELKYVDGERHQVMQLPMTFADFAITENRFRKHFRVAPPDVWNDAMIPLAEFLELPADDRQGRFPFIWSIDRDNNLTRLIVARPMVDACEDRRDFWLMLKDISKTVDNPVDQTAIESNLKQQIVKSIAAGVMKWVTDATNTDHGEGPVISAGSDRIDSYDQRQLPGSTGNESTRIEPAVQPNANDQVYIKPWIDSDRCTACGECIGINPSIFAYDDKKKAYIKNATGGPYRDLVKAAELCTAQVIHPGVPQGMGGERSVADLDKWIKRGRKFN